MFSRNARSFSDSPLVFFDIEATGLIQFGELPDIVQLAAVSQDDDVFDRYILPEKSMTPGAQIVTGIRVEGDTLLRHGQRVPTVRLRDAMRDFLSWLRKVAEDAGGKKPIILAYNGFKFDVPVLRNALRKCGLEAEAKEAIAGYADPWQMATAMIPKREVGNFRLNTLTRKYCGGVSHDAHNAVGDCKALKRVYNARLCSANLGIYTYPF